MKIAYLIAGDFKYLDLCYENQLEHLFNKYDVDIFISTVNYTAHKKNLSSFNKAIDNYNFTNLDKESIMFNCFNQFSSKIKSMVINNNSVNNNFIPWLNQFELLQRAKNMLIQHEIDNYFKYDIIIRSRFDILFGEDLDIKESDFISVPTRYHHDLDLLKKVTSDQFSYGSRDLMIKYCDFINYYKIYEKEIVESILNNTYNDRLDLIPEYKLSEYLKSNDIKISNKTIKAYPYNWIKDLLKDKNNLYIKDLPENFIRKITPLNG